MLETARWSRGGFIAVCVAILLIAATLRIDGLGAQSFWNDEGNSAVQAARPLGETIDHAARDIHPPGYYLLLGAWRALMGDSEVALRSLSVFASVLTVAVAMVLTMRLYGWIAALCAGVFIALNTFSIYYAQEARMYAVLALWVALAFWALSEFMVRASWRWAVVLALVNVAGLYTQYAYPLFMAAQGVVALIWLLRPQRGATFPTRALLIYIGANVFTLVCFAPWLPTALRQITMWPNTAVPTPPAEAFSAIMRVLIFGLVPTLSASAIALILMLFGMLIVARRPTWASALPSLWVLVPVGAFVLLNLYQPDDLKLLLPAQVGVAIWIGRGIWTLWTGGALSVRAGLRALTMPNRTPDSDRRLRFVLQILRVTAVFSLLWMVVTLQEGIAPLRTDAEYARADYRGIAAEISAHAQNDDAVILDAPNQAEVFRYYFTRADVPIYPLPEGLGGDDEATRLSVERVIATHTRLYVVFWGERERDPRRVVEKTLDERAFELGDVWYGDVRLARYAVPVALPIAVPSGARFGDAITLIDSALNATTFNAGEVLQAELRWVTDTLLETRYKVFLQVLDANGVLVAQRDSEPGGGLALTTTWTPEGIVPDRHALALDLPAGEYTLIIGMYPLEGASARLTVNDDGDYLLLTPIVIR